MKRIFLTVIIALSAVLSFAQTSLAWEYNIKARDWSPIVASKIRTLDKVVLIRSLDLSFIFAAQSGTGAPSVGIMASRSWKIATGIDAMVGITGRVTQGQIPKLFGVAFGVSW